MCMIFSHKNESERLRFEISAHKKVIDGKKTVDSILV